MRHDHSIAPGDGCRGLRRRCGIGRGLLLTVAAVAQACSPASELPPDTARIAAASDLQFALSDVAEQFARDTEMRVELVFGSSGTLTRQIQDGAPFDLFLSADEGFVAQLERAGRTRDGGVLYGVGRLVLFAPPGSPLAPADGLDGLGRRVAQGQIARLAIANPAHAPYGRAAEQALVKHGLWEAVQPILVLGENVSQAAQFATTGNAAGGIIAHSLALAPAMREEGTYALIAAEAHDPLRQRMVLLDRAGPVAERFYQYLQDPPARETLERYGFSLPD